MPEAVSPRTVPITLAIPRETRVVNQHIIVRLRADNGAIGWGEMSDI